MSALVSAVLDFETIAPVAPEVLSVPYETVLERGLAAQDLLYDPEALAGAAECCWPWKSRWTAKKDSGDDNMRVFYRDLLAHECQVLINRICYWKAT